MDTTRSLVDAPASAVLRLDGLRYGHELPEILGGTFSGCRGKGPGAGSA